MKKFSLPLILSASFLLLSIACPSFAAEPNDIYQWQIQKYPQTQREFKDIVADQSVIQEKPEAISKKHNDKLRHEAVEAKKRMIEENERAAMEEKLGDQDISQNAEMNAELDAEMSEEEMPADDGSISGMDEISDNEETSDEAYSEDSGNPSEWQTPETTSESPYSGY